MKVKSILTCNAVKLRRFSVESNQYIGTATKLREINELLFIRHSSDDILPFPQALSFETYWGALNKLFLECSRRAVVEKFAMITIECNGVITI